MKPLAIGFFLLSVSSLCFANCNAELLNAMRSTHNTSSELTLAQSVKEVVCNFNQQSHNGALQLSVPNIALAAGGSSASLTRACISNDEHFFLRHDQQLATSLIPNKAIQACFGGLSFTVVESTDSSVINVEASFHPPGSGALAKVEGFSWEPESALDCNFDWMSQETVIIPGGIAGSCSRLQRTAVSITLNTTEGARSLMLEPVPMVERQVFEWRTEVWPPNTFWYSCANQLDESVGELIWCASPGVGTCHSPARAANLCAGDHGTHFYVVDGTDVIKPY